MTLTNCSLFTSSTSCGTWRSSLGKLPSPLRIFAHRLFAFVAQTRYVSLHVIHSRHKIDCRMLLHCYVGQVITLSEKVQVSSYYVNHLLPYCKPTKALFLLDARIHGPPDLQAVLLRFLLLQSHKHKSEVLRLGHGAALDRLYRWVGLVWF